MKFNYLARTKEGEIQTGIVEASDKESAIATLHSYGLVVIKVESVKKTPIFAKKIRIFQRVKDRDLVEFSRQLSLMVSSGIPLLEALQSLVKQTENDYFKEILFKISKDVEGGVSLDKALAKFPKVFSSLYVNLVKSGEVTGQLAEVLEYLADHLEKEYYLKSKVKGAMIYPIFVLSMLILVGIFMLYTVVPKLVEIVEGLGQELPLPTRIIIRTSNFVREWGWIILIFLVIISIGAWYWRKTKRGGMFFDKFKLKLPIFGKIYRKVYLARFCENLSTLLKGGLLILRALNVSGSVVGNKVYKDIIYEARDEVRIGNTMSSVFEKYPKQFPPVVVQMIRTGEKTGKIEFILRNLADFYSKEVNNIVANLSRFIEPVLIIGLGLMVGILIAAILMPIYNMTTAF